MHRHDGDPGELDPDEERDVVVAPGREREAERDEDERGRRPDDALEQDGARSLRPRRRAAGARARRSARRHRRPPSGAPVPPRSSRSRRE